MCCIKKYVNSTNVICERRETLFRACWGILFGFLELGLTNCLGDAAKQGLTEGAILVRGSRSIKLPLSPPYQLITH